MVRMSEGVRHRESKQASTIIISSKFIQAAQGRTSCSVNIDYENHPDQ